MEGFVTIEGREFAEKAGTRHSFKEFKELHPWLKDAETAYKAVGGTIQKKRKPKADSED